MSTIKVKSDLNFWKLWNISFGFFGVQIAYALQSTNINRIFVTLGADPRSLGYFWILPPLAGIIIQSIIGLASDKTWTHFGRRIPYLFVGSLIAVLVMYLLPNTGSFGTAVGTAMTSELVSLMFLDTSISMAMRPFKMLVGDMVNEKRKGLAYSIQSFPCNTSSLVGYLFPFIFTFIGISNTASKGAAPDSVIYSFYIDAAILILYAIYTIVKVKEMLPKEFEEFHSITAGEKEKKADFISLLKHIPKVFWTVGLIQFFCWAAFMYMWTYTNGAIAATVWGTTGAQSAGYQEAGNRVGVLFAVQTIDSVIWTVVLPLFKARKQVYILSLMLDDVEFISILFFHDEYLLLVSYLLIGYAQAAMLALSFTILTNSVSGKDTGAYLGLFSGAICVLQIVAALVGGGILHPVGRHQVNMLILAGVLLIVGTVCVYFIKRTIVRHEKQAGGEYMPKPTTKGAE